MVLCERSDDRGQFGWLRHDRVVVGVDVHESPPWCGGHDAFDLVPPVSVEASARQHDDHRAGDAVIHVDAWIHRGMPLGRSRGGDFVGGWSAQISPGAVQEEAAAGHFAHESRLRTGVEPVVVDGPTCSTVIQTLGWRRPLLIGHSTGGYAVTAVTAAGLVTPAALGVVDGLVLDDRATAAARSRQYCSAVVDSAVL